MELHGDELRVDHAALGRAGVNVAPVDGHNGGGGVEILIFQLTERAAVDGVGVVRAEMRQIEAVRAAADLLIRREADAQGRVRAALGQQLLHGGQNFRDARLVVRAEQRRAVRDDQVLADAAVQDREIRGAEHRIFVQCDVAARVFHDTRLDVLAGAVRRGVHMGNEADGGRTGRAGHGAVDIAVRVDAGVRNTERAHLLHKRFAEQLLLCGRGAGLRALIRLCVEGNIVQKAFRYRHIRSPFQLSKTAPAFGRGRNFFLTCRRALQCPARS